MSRFLTVLAFALLPALGNFLGGLLAEFWHTSKRNLNRALHAAAGIVFAIVAVELMPRALQSSAGWMVGVAFGLGGLAYIGVKGLVERVQKHQEDGTIRCSMWMIYIAVATDLFSDGLMVGSGTAVGTSLALVLALGQVLADVPEGFVTIAIFRDKGVPRQRRLILTALFAIPVVLAAVLAYYLLRNQSETLKMAALVFTAGLLMVAVVEDMITEAHESAQDAPGSVLAMVGGFVLFTFISAGLE